MVNHLKETKQLFFKIISFSDFRYRFFTFLIILFLLFIIPIEFLEKSPNLSICSYILGDYCYSIGITRGVSSLLKGNLSQAINYNFLSVPVLVVMLLIIIRDFTKIISQKMSLFRFELKTPGSLRFLHP